MLVHGDGRQYLTPWLASILAIKESKIYCLYKIRYICLNISERSLIFHNMLNENEGGFNSRLMLVTKDEN